MHCDGVAGTVVHGCKTGKKERSSAPGLLGRDVVFSD